MHHKAFYIQDDIVSKKVVKVPISELLYIDKVIDYSPITLAALSPRSRKEIDSVTCKFKYSFTLCTVSRKYTLFARTQEEQFLWMSSFYRVLNVEVADSSYKVPKYLQKVYSSKQLGYDLIRVRDNDEIRVSSLQSEYETNRLSQAPSPLLPPRPKKLEK
jgi:hypothetical protein